MEFDGVGGKLCSGAVASEGDPNLSHCGIFNESGNGRRAALPRATECADGATGDLGLPYATGAEYFSSDG